MIEKFKYLEKDFNFDLAFLYQNQLKVKISKN